MSSPDLAEFYDLHPFDWVRSSSPADMDSIVARPLAEFIRSLDEGALVLDIGCGPGRVLGLLAQRGTRCIGLDRSRVSVQMARNRYGRPTIVADNLKLPLADGMADAVISDGVIHHTNDPLASFTENCRVLKPGARMYLAVYKPTGRYPFLYKHPGALIRRGLQHSWSRPLVFLFGKIPYFLFHFARSKGRRTWGEAQNLFYDYFVTPLVAFLPRQLVEEWSGTCGVRVVQYEENPGLNIHSFLCLKEDKEESQHSSGSKAESHGSSLHRREIQ
ncbi:MAG TPA: class I SAM-dependent methyltransferase [Candidatus Limnocylindrales bacterium]|nr:class I SAM-dependent methyltransferase [Candidatus Limnocylindrales bacterium]